VLPSRVTFLSLVCLASFAVKNTTAQQPSTVFRSGVELVHIGVTVTDNRGNIITDLAAADFEVVEDGRPHAITYFSAGDRTEPPAPEMHLGLLLDVSESMGEDIGFTKTAAVRFLNTLTDALDVTVVDFDTEVRVGRYGQGEFARMIERIRQQKADGNTALYDAIAVYLDGAVQQAGRKIMLLYTDGGDTRSAIRFGELVDVLKASDVTVYAVGVLEHQSQSARTAQRRILQQIAEATGGQAYFPLSVRTLDSVYERVLAEIRGQYTLGYLPTNPRSDGAWREIEVKVVRTDGRQYRVRSRKGYYGPYRP
jgi:Ca-activated chloride channel homolog